MRPGEKNSKFFYIDFESVKNAAMNLYSYELGLIKPLALKGNLQKNRRGIIVEMIFHDGTFAFGEISPLPFFSQESYEDALKQVKKIREKFNSESGKPGESMQEIISGNNRLLPSVQTGIEMALLNYSFYKETAMKKAVGKNPDDFVLLNGLISLRAGASDKEIESEAERIMEKGYKTVKIKVGRQKPDDDISMIKRIISIAGGDLRLRFDANCSWDLETAMYFVKKLNCSKIAQATDYIEDPLKNTADLECLYKQTGIGIAVDETQFIPIKTCPFLKAVIIKPTVAGGFEAASEKIEYCKSAGILPVLSSSFETGLGIASIALFARMKKLSSAAAGLATLEWFGSDILNNKLTVKNGRLLTADAAAAISDMDFNKLKLIN